MTSQKLIGEVIIMTKYNELTKAERMKLASELIDLESEHEFADGLVQMLLEEADRIEKANARSRGRRTQSKAQKERAQVVEQIVEYIENNPEVKEVYYDSVGIVALVGLDYTPQRAIHVARDLIELNMLKDLGDKSFGDNKKRKAYAIGNGDEPAPIVAYDMEQEEE